MIIITNNTGYTSKAQLRSLLTDGFRPIAACTCTAGEEAAAHTLIEKHYSLEASKTLLEVTVEREVIGMTGDFTKRNRKTRYRIWRFQPIPKLPTDH